MQTFFKHEMPTRAQAKAKRDHAVAVEQQRVYRLVERRDQFRCRACTRRVTRTPEMVPGQLHHHHVIFRSAGGGDTSHNVATICRLCHDDCHAGKLTMRGSADGRLTFWREGKKWRG